jgi:hypothetical protein
VSVYLHLRGWLALGCKVGRNINLYFENLDSVCHGIFHRTCSIVICSMLYQQSLYHSLDLRHDWVACRGRGTTTTSKEKSVAHNADYDTALVLGTFGR